MRRLCLIVFLFLISFSFAGNYSLTFSGSSVQNFPPGYGALCAIRNAGRVSVSLSNNSIFFNTSFCGATPYITEVALPFNSNRIGNISINCSSASTCTVWGSSDNRCRGTTSTCSSFPCTACVEVHYVNANTNWQWKWECTSWDSFSATSGEVFGSCSVSFDVSNVDCNDADAGNEFLCNCSTTESGAQAFLAARQAECESEGNDYSGKVVLQGSGDYCVEGECKPPPPSSSSSASESSSSFKFDSSSSSEEGDFSSSSGGEVSSSSSEEGASSSSSEDWVSSSSSEEGASSSSSGDWVSSSSRAEDGDCYGSELEASYAFSTKLIQCQANGGDISEMKLAGRCITGSCRSPFSSSSLGGMGSSSSSFGDGGGEDVCVAARRLLQKTADASDDWVYIGKEVYGRKKTVLVSIKPGAKLFDVMGRTYDRVRARIMYYVFNDAIKREELETVFEFDVWKRIIEDSEGRDIQVFIKNDELRKFRRDSSFYWDGRWEVFEFDDLARETRYRTSSGTRSLRRYDDKERLTERYMMGENGDTLTSERYEWQNGRLTRMTANGVVRNYIYGKTLQDMVRVVPSDEGFNFHRGYNGTAGKIPEEGEPGYRIFARNPYGHVHFGKIEDDDELEEENELPDIYFAPKKSATTSSVNILGKIVTRSCVNNIEGMPEAWCIKFQEKDALANLTRDVMLYGFPSNNKKPVYGMSYRKLFLKSRCECNELGKYQPVFTGNTTDEKIEVYQNFWKYNATEKKWQEICWGGTSLAITYNHEVQHIRNARIIAATLNAYALKYNFDTKRECEVNVSEERRKLEIKWDEWLEREQAHLNPNSPKYSGDRYPYACN